MRVDDMIFLRPEARSGLSPEKFRWPNGIIPYTIERNLCKHLESNLNS